MPYVDKISNGVHSYGSFTLHETGNVNGSDGFQYINTTVHATQTMGQGMGPGTG